MKRLAIIACLGLSLAACSHTQEQPKQACVSPLPDLISKQISVFGDNYPDQFAVFHFITLKDSNELNHYGVLTVLFFSRVSSDYTIKHLGSKSYEQKSFYQYPSIFGFPILKNVHFDTNSGKRFDYIEQDLHVLFPAHHLSEKNIWELVTSKGAKIPLFQSPIPGAESFTSKPDPKIKPDFKLASEIVLASYCMLPKKE